MTADTDILILGGGPAGCSAALGLARLGYAVLLITRPRRAAVEGLSERVLQALETGGCRAARAAIGPPVRREASWNGATAAANQEWVVARERFDAALLADAAAAGVAILAARTARLTHDADGWQVATGDGQRRSAGFLVEARGRAAPGRRLRGPASTALTRRFAGVPPCPRTAIATFARGWAWYASTGDGTGTLQIVVASAEPLPKRPALPALFDAALAETAPARDWLGSGQAAVEVATRHAEASRAVRPLEQRLFRIGDAALAPDPLSGHGVFEALASARSAVAVINTLLRRPQDAALAHAFYEERVRLAFERFARIGRDFYRLEQRWPDAPFWQARRRWPDDLPAHAPATASAPQIATRPVIEDGFVALREVILTADQPRGVWQVGGVPLVAVLRAAQAGEPAPAEADTALAWLRYRGLLRS
jgi:flavin-dependent dehydrogenase